MIPQREVVMQVNQWVQDAATANGGVDIVSTGTRVHFKYDGMIVKIKVEAILDRGGNRVAGKVQA